MAQARKHKWTWDDIRPPPRDRHQIELDLLSCLLNCPYSINQLSQLQISFRFDKPIHARTFKQIKELMEEDVSYDGPDIIRRIVRESLKDNQFGSIRNVMELMSAHSEPPTTERIIELGTQLSKFS